MKNINWNWRTVLELVMLGIILALVLVLLFSSSPGKTATVTYITPQENIKDGPYAQGSRIALREGPEIEGYTFVGWRDANGEIVTTPEIYVNEDAFYSAVYSVGLEKNDHIVFLDNENGLFRPDDPLTRSEMAIMLYRLMDLNMVGTAEFLDVEKTDSCYKACSTLKDLGILSGNYFHKDDAVSHAEFSEILSLLGESGRNNLKNPDSDEFLTRAETAEVMCSVLNRGGDSADRKELVGTFLDVSPNSPAFWAVAESTMTHDFSGTGENEKWTSCNALPKHSPGFFYVGTRLHYIDENGDPVLDGTAKGFDFNSKGEITSGDEAVDAYISKILNETIDPETQSSSEMLRTLFDYVAKDDHFKYLVRNYYEIGDTSWVLDEARTMLKTRKGNCYNFAAVFYELARSIGYDAKIFSGTMGTDYRPHAWVEIERNGEMMLYDPEYQYAHPDLNMYQRDSSFMQRYHYRKEPVGASEDQTSGKEEKPSASSGGI